MSKEYKIMKNFIHNDCKINKEDIKKMIQDEVKEAIKKTDLDTLIKKEIVAKLTSDNVYGGISYETKEILKKTNEFLDSAVQKAIRQAINDNIVIQFKESMVDK